MYLSFDLASIRYLILLCKIWPMGYLYRSKFQIGNFGARIKYSLPQSHTWPLPFVIVSRPSVDKEEDGRGRGPTGVAGCGWLTCEAISSDSQRSSSSLTSLSICSLWASVSRPRRSSWQTKTDKCKYNVHIPFDFIAAKCSTSALQFAYQRSTDDWFCIFVTVNNTFHIPMLMWVIDTKSTKWLCSHCSSPPWLLPAACPTRLSFWLWPSPCLPASQSRHLSWTRCCR